MSLPRPEVTGGPATVLPLLRAGLEAQGVRIVPFNYTRRRDIEARWRKPIERGKPREKQGSRGLGLGVVLQCPTATADVHPLGWRGNSPPRAAN